jgi:hypothetical protein
LRATLSFALIAASALCFAGSSTIKVEVGATRSSDTAMAQADQAVANASRNIGNLLQRSRARRIQLGLTRADTPIIVPFTVRLTQNGQELPFNRTRANGDEITLQFDASGSRAFPPQYRDFLQSVFDSAKPTINLLFGSPSFNGTLRVANYDLDIGDREAVTGGYFVPNNGSGDPEIRFPVYLSPEATAVNFIHTLLLAYMGPNVYAYDPWQEGLVRAVAMRVVRTPGALPNGLDQSQIEAVIANSYDVGGLYDWYNQPGLAGTQFIAPNLRDVPLPAGGSVGGLYLLRHRMAGSAWQKLLVQYPTFVARLNAQLYNQPSLASDPNGLLIGCQAALNAIAGPASKVEGFSLAEWVKRQYILHFDSPLGEKLVVEPTPITSGLAGSDFGVFLIEVHYFDTLKNGNELLLTGTSFPIFWEGTNFLNRIFPSAQEDRLDIAGAYGSTVPNFPSNIQNGQPYRGIADIAVQDKLQRVYLPAGAIAKATDPVESTFFGTVIGHTVAARVKATVGANLVADLPVLNGAFGGNVTAQPFLNAASVVIEVVRQDNGQVLLSRRVNKGPGSLALDLRIGGDTTFTFTNLPAGLNGIGLPIQPYRTSIPEILALNANQVLAARYNPSRAGYDLYPDIEPFLIGHSYFVNLPAPKSITVDGTTHPGMAMSVALRPGWNMITSPLKEAVPTNRIQVVRGVDFPADYTEAAGSLIGIDFFQYVQNQTNPNLGAYVEATQFEPGKTYFVRVLAPEGVTMVFSPVLATTAQTRAVLQNEPNLLSLPGWTIRIAASGAGMSDYAFIGTSTVATRGFDPKLDSGSPPAIGGLQVSSILNGRLFRDMRPVSTYEKFTVRLDNLVPGQTYFIRLTNERGRTRTAIITDTSIGWTNRYVMPTTYTFQARSTSHTLEVSAQ